MSTFAERVLKLRTDRGISARQLSARMQASNGYVSLIECGRIKNLSLLMAVRLCEALDCSLEDLYPGVGYKLVKVR